MTLRRFPHRLTLTPQELQEFAAADQEWRSQNNVPVIPPTRRTAPIATVALVRDTATALPLTANEKETLDLLLSSWDNRHPQFRTSVRHEATRARLLPLCALSPAHRFKAFEQIRVHCEWDTSTAKTYWEVLMGTMEIAQSLIPSLQVSALDRQVMHNLRVAHDTAPPKPPSIISPPQLQQACVTLRRQEKMGPALALELAYTTLQRMPDVVKAETNLLVRVGNMAALSLHAGKVAHITGTWTIHAHKELATDLLAHAATQQAAGDTLLFGKNASRAIKAVLPPSTSLLAIRKGAAISHALAGGDLEDAQSMMRHRSDDRTIYYLGCGVYDMTAARRAARVADLVAVAPLIRQAAHPATPVPTPPPRQNVPTSALAIPPKTPAPRSGGKSL